MATENQTSSGGERHLTVYTKHQQRTWGDYAQVPEIRLCGKWLEQAGFETGQSVTVTHHQNKIIITPATVEEQNAQ